MRETVGEDGQPVGVSAMVEAVIAEMGEEIFVGFGEGDEVGRSGCGECIVEGSAEGEGVPARGEDGLPVVIEGRGVEEVGVLKDVDEALEAKGRGVEEWVSAEEGRTPRVGVTATLSESVEGELGIAIAEGGEALKAWEVGHDGP